MYISWQTLLHDVLASDVDRQQVTQNLQPKALCQVPHSAVLASYVGSFTGCQFTKLISLSYNYRYAELVSTS